MAFFFCSWFLSSLEWQLRGGWKRKKKKKFIKDKFFFFFYKINRDRSRPFQAISFLDRRFLEIPRLDSYYRQPLLLFVIVASLMLRRAQYIYQWPIHCLLKSHELKRLARFHWPTRWCSLIKMRKPGREHNSQFQWVFFYATHCQDCTSIRLNRRSHNLSRLKNTTMRKPVDKLMVAAKL